MKLIELWNGVAQEAASPERATSTRCSYEWFGIGQDSPIARVTGRPSCITLADR